jgi:hypothetical protein
MPTLVPIGFWCPPDVKGRADLLDHAHGELGRILGLILSHLEDRELTTAHARHKIMLSDGFLQPRRDMAQKLIANAMAESVVDMLEPIKIEGYHGKAPRSAGMLQLGMQGVNEPVAFGKLGQ